MTVAMKTPTLTWEQTLAALLPLVDTRVWATTSVNESPVVAFSEHRRRVDVRPTHFTNVEEARLASVSSPAWCSSTATST